ncbi:MAG: hypothetical protein AAFQ01_04240 [Bacteroidota bacterium]
MGGAFNADFTLVIFAVVGLSYRRRQHDAKFLIALLVCHLGLAYVATNGFEQYVRQLAPLYAIVVGSFAGEGFQRLSQNPLADRRQLAAWSLILLVPLTQTMWPPLTHIAERRPLHFQPPALVEWLQQNIACEEAVILGPHYHYIWMSDYNYGSIKIDRYLLTIPQYAEMSAEEIFRMVEPAYVIMDPNFPSRSVLLGDSDDYLLANGYLPIEERTVNDEPVRVYGNERVIAQQCLE